LSGYYHKLVPNFADISAALSDLLKKGTKFVWIVEAERAFLDLKSRLATQLILPPPDFPQPFSLAVDASDVAIGAVLLQEVDGIQQPSVTRVTSSITTRSAIPPWRRKR